jgi:hypothetical protein
MRTIRSNSAGSLGSTSGAHERSSGVVARSPGYASISSATRCQPQFPAAPLLPLVACVSLPVVLVFLPRGLLFLSHTAARGLHPVRAA